MVSNRGAALAATAGLALALALIPAASAGAHATLESTTPERGAVLAEAPREVALRFDEPVELALGSLRVFAADGDRVERGAAYHPRGDGDAVAVRLRDDLPRGGYTATYRVISADSHPIAGGFVFSVGAGAATPATAVGERLDDQDAGPVTAVAFSGVRAIEYGAIALGVGALVVLMLVWPPGLRAATPAAPRLALAATAFGDRLRVLLALAAVAGALAAALALALQAATATGTSLWAALDDTGAVLETRFGTVWGLGGLVWLVVLVVAIARPLPAGPIRPAAEPGSAATVAGLALALLVLAFLPGLGGHAGAQDPVAVLAPANVVHVLAAGAWIGGVAVLVLALPAATRQLERGDRARLLAATLARFSAVALVAVTALLVGGILQALLELDGLADLTGTAFGRAILIKAALVLGLLGLGALNRCRLLPALARAASDGAAPGRAGVLLRRSLRAELALGVAAIAVTGALAGYAPASARTAGPYSGSATLGPARAELTVDPAQAGPNQVHLYLFDKRHGRQYDAPKDLRIDAELPARRIEPIALAAHKAGPGHYTIADAALSPPGEWRLEIVARVSDFDEIRTSFEIPIR